MRAILTFTVSILFLNISSAQNQIFKGKIVYEYTFLNPSTGQDITKTMAEFLGFEQHYFIDGENYKSLDEKGEFRQLYNSSINMYYYKNPQSGEVLGVDASENAPAIISIDHPNETKEILDMLCKKVIITSESGDTEYWYNENIKVDPEVFKDHAFGEWAAFLKASGGSLPLEYIVTTPYYRLTSTAISIEEMEFTEYDFDLSSVIDQ